MTQPNAPLPLDVRTDETLQKGTLLIQAETQGGAVFLRQLRTLLLAEFPGWVYQREDSRYNIPDPPPTEG